MHHLTFLAVALWLADSADECHGASTEVFIPLHSAMRIRLGEGIFRQLSRVVEYLFNKHIRRAVIAPQQQCFPEGCVNIQDFRLVAHRTPSFVAVVPTPPNLLTLRISDFDFHIAGTLYGQLQPLPLVPVTIPAYGTLSISATQLVIGATFDIQKTADDVPFIRVIACSLLNEITVARVENMGLFTDIVNAKYQYEITAKAREVLQKTLCINVNSVVNEELNSRLKQIPNRISILDLYRLLFESSDETGKQKVKRALEPVPNYPQIPFHIKFPTSDILRGSQNSVPTALASVQRNVIKQPVVVNSSAAVTPATKLSKSEKTFFNTRKLALLILSLSILDTSANYERFFAGLDGDVNFGAYDRIRNPYRRPERLRFPQTVGASGADLLISEYTINTLLLKAHNIGALVFNVQSSTPILGKLLRTTCTIDEVCLSDSVPEAGEKYPNRQLEVILRTTQPPTAVIFQGIAIVVIEGRALFFVEETAEKVGVIPFRAELQCRVVSLQRRLVGSMKLVTLEFSEGVSFFGLSVQSLNGFKEAAKGAVTSMLSKKIAEGISLNAAPGSRLSNVSLSLIDGAILLQTNFDIERSFYQYTPIIPAVLHR